MGNPTTRAIQSCKRLIVKLWYKIFGHKPTDSGCFSFGNKQTSVYLLEAKGDWIGIAPRNIQISVDPDHDVKQGTMTEEIAYFCDSFSAELQDRTIDSKGVNWNGKPLSLYEYTDTRTAGDESVLIRLTLLKNEYNTTKIVTNHLQDICPITGRRMRDYIDSYDFCRSNSYELPNSIGVCFLVETKDGKVIFAHRDKEAGFRPDEWDVSVVEGLEEKKDAPGNIVDIKSVFLRAYKEEICNIEESNFRLTILGLVIDKKYGQWNFIGKVNCSLTEKEIRSRRANGDVEDRWELRELVFCDSNLKAIMGFLSTHKMWDMGLVTVYYSLLAMGETRGDVDKAIRRHYTDL